MSTKQGITKHCEQTAIAAMFQDFNQLSTGIMPGKQFI